MGAYKRRISEKVKEVTESSVQTSNPNSSSVKSSAGRTLVGLLLLLVVVVGGFAGYQYWEMQRLKLILSAQSAANDKARLTLEKKVTDSLETQTKQVDANLADLTQRLELTSSKVLALTNQGHDDWKLAEVDYLLRMANQRILMEHEASDSLALAESANGVLAELQNADLFSARKKLTEEIEALKLANKVDREGIYLQLLAITQQIESLPLIEPLYEDEEEGAELPEMIDETTGQPIELSLWDRTKNLGKRAWHKLSTYVRVRDQGRRVDAILPPEDQMYLKQNLRLMLEQAQIGLLREEQHVYQASLDKASNWIHEYYPLNDQSQIVLNDLEQLKKNNVQQPLPDFSGSAAMIKEYLRQKDKMAFSRRGGN